MSCPVLEGTGNTTTFLNTNIYDKQKTSIQHNNTSIHVLYLLHNTIYNTQIYLSDVYYTIYKYRPNDIIFCS